MVIQPHRPLEYQMYEPVSLAPRVCPSLGCSNYCANLRPALVPLVKTVGHLAKVIFSLVHPSPAIITAVDTVRDIATC
jgi:hypothetical protein